MSPTHNPDNSQHSQDANTTTILRRISRGLMKRACFLLAAAFCIASTATLASAVPCTSTASGTWSVGANWDCGHQPTSGDNAITIASGHTMTIAANVTVDEVTINSGGQITINSGVTVTIANGTGTDLTVSGTLRSANNITLSAGATVVFNSGGRFQHNFANGGTIPTATWDVNSTVEVVGAITGTSAPGGLGQTFGHFHWNPVSQTSAMNLVGGLTTVNGNFTISSTGTGDLRLSSAGSTLTVAGNFSQTAGTFNLVNGNNNTGTLNVAGDFSHTGGTITVGGNAVTNGQIVFNKSGTQTFTSGGTVTGNVDFTVNSGSTLQMAAAGTTVTGRGFILSSGRGPWYYIQWRHRFLRRHRKYSNYEPHLSHRCKLHLQRQRCANYRFRLARSRERFDSQQQCRRDFDERSDG